ncbi:MAG: hypothetical protein J6S52_04485, partial [Prevotella sp.]|nr:hypothetical protein [Prevotella sp.]
EGGNPQQNGLSPLGGVGGGCHEEAVGALTMLGFAPAPSSKVVKEILQGNPDMPVEQVVKLALKMIK